MSSVKKFFVHFSHFFLGNLSHKLLGFITFPILTRLLSEDQYGILGLVTTTSLFVVALAKAGLSDGIIRMYSNYRDTEKARSLFSSTVLIRGALMSAFTVLLYILLFPVISRYLHIDNKFLMCFMIMSAYLFIRPLNIIVLNLLRVNGKTIFMNVATLISRIISTGLSLLLLIYILRTLSGYFVGVVLGELFLSIILFYWFFSNYTVSTRNASWELASNLIKFGAPLLISELSFLLLTYADRYMIVALIGDSALGLYSVGYNLPMYIADILNFSIAYSIIPIFVEIYDKDGRAKTEEFLKQSMNFLLIAIIPMLFGYFAVSKELIVTLASQKYASAYSFSPIILLGTIILGLNNILNAGLYLKKKSIMILAVMLSATLINIGLNFIMIPRYGVMGAALSTLAGCIAAMCITIYLSFKYVVVSIDVRTVLYYIGVSCIMVLVIHQLSIAPVWMNLIAKIAVGFLIFFIGLIIREREMLGKITRFYFPKNTL